MNPFPIGNQHNPPFNNVDGNLVNKFGTTNGGNLFSNTITQNGPHTLAPPGSNVQSAAGIYPSFKGGKINRKKINKISRKYKMKGSKRTIKRHIRRIKTRMRSKYTRRSRRRSSRRRYLMRGGAFQSPQTTPNYPAGHSQYQNNNGSISNTYSLGGNLTPSLVGLASPPPHNVVANASIPDNLNHATLNSYGNIGSGSGFPSRGWF
jgi:hypothetical protein